MTTTTTDALDQLKAAIKASGKAPYRLGIEAGVDPTGVHRFVTGTGGISFRSAARLMRVLGLELRKRM
jgi:hypothetical protein